MLAAINRLCFETQGESDLKNDFNQNCKLPLSATFIYVDWIEWHIIIPALPRSSFIYSQFPLFRSLSHGRSLSFSRAEVCLVILKRCFNIYLRTQSLFGNLIFRQLSFVTNLNKKEILRKNDISWERCNSFNFPVQFFHH